MRPHALALSDRQLKLVKAAAASVPVQRRDAFVKQIANRLCAEPSDVAVAQAINLALDCVYAADNGMTNEC